MSASIPTLHQLCCDVIVDAVINLDNAPFILSFARQHNAQELCQRAERFCCNSWRGLNERHDSQDLREALGADVFDALERDRLELERQRPRVGSIIEPPPTPALPLLPTQAPSAPSRPSDSSAALRQGATETAAAARARARFSGGGGETCLVCSKRVYPAERAPGMDKAYHIACFRCTACSAKLGPHNYELTDCGKLLCKPHFRQHTNTTARASTASADYTATPGPIGFTFDGESCVRCGKRVYAAERQVAGAHRGCFDSLVFHKACFRCKECNRGPLRPGDWVVDADSGDLLCKQHHTARQHAAAAAAQP